MPVFDSANPSSAEAAALWHLAELLSECEAFQALTEKSSASEAIAKVAIGYHEAPWDSESYSEAELAELFCEAHLISPLAGDRAVVQSDGSPVPDEGGTFDMVIRRYVRPSEIQDRSDLYLWFLDKIAALEMEIITNAEVRECPRLTSITREAGPAFGQREEDTAQGEYLWTKHSIAWGDAIEE